MEVPYSYDPIIDRRPLGWPKDARLAFWLTPNIEVFRLGMPITAQGVMTPSVSSYAQRDYGNRVAIWRVMEVLERHRVKATVALNAEVCERTPRVIEEAKKLGWEFMGHGLTNSILLPDLSASEQAEHIRQTVRMIKEGTGTAPRGWFSAGLAETPDTLDQLVDSGIEYLADWVADDQPFWMRTRAGRLIGMPYGQVNDIGVFSDRGRDPAVFVTLVKNAFDTLYNESAATGRVLAISIHPFIIGHPSLVIALDEALAYVMRHEGVWATTGSEIIDYYRQQVPPPQ